MVNSLWVVPITMVTSSSSSSYAISSPLQDKGLSLYSTLFILLKSRNLEYQDLQSQESTVKKGWKTFNFPTKVSKWNTVVEQKTQGGENWSNANWDKSNAKIQWKNMRQFPRSRMKDYSSPLTYMAVR